MPCKSSPNTKLPSPFINWPWLSILKSPLLDNAISFSGDQQKIEIDLTETSNNFVMTIKDQGPGFTEASPQKIFKRFYSNRPSNFGEHSGLGLNIAKNIVELHKGAIAASNRINQKGAQVEVLLPKILS